MIIKFYGGTEPMDCQPNRRLTFFSAAHAARYDLVAAYRKAFPAVAQFWDEKPLVLPPGPNLKEQGYRLMVNAALGDAQWYEPDHIKLSRLRDKGWTDVTDMDDEQFAAFIASLKE